MHIERLTAFIVTAKRATYVGDGKPVPASRAGQEVVWHAGDPIWAMNYYGYITRPDLIDARRAGTTIKAALSALYAEDRFLGGFDWQGPHGRYVDTSEGDAAHFHGREHILVDDIEAYALDYAGGLIKV